ncbi:PhzF family phenazine biosynthesis protein [Stieleria varia]|uniref:Putative isomerase YddE n=1 Tax=Stieleria varia TaxID=2528005 RepID=A0A5C6BA62_9BACT|nr:PhzF family phenazine biosynthesis protein [Stieleria varia]TWU08156.1 putative isomerase YddE [Stieleria varia]
MSGILIWQVDAFADRPLAGNPAAVCILERYTSDEWMQGVASEMSLSETAFLVPISEVNCFQLRWFTPAAEVDLCGHATLAAAHILIQHRLIDSQSPIRFRTRSGELTCTSFGARITLDFPAMPATKEVDASTARTLLAALGIAQAVVMQSKFDLLVVVNESDTVTSLRPDFNALQQVETRGVMVTAPSQTADVDFISRYFAPRFGINEDPVTGSAHCCLAPYWAKQLGKTSLVGYQASARGGTVHCEVRGDRVRLTGNAVTVLEGRLMMDVPS